MEKFLKISTSIFMTAADLVCLSVQYLPVAVEPRDRSQYDNLAYRVLGSSIGETRLNGSAHISSSGVSDIIYIRKL